MQESPPGYLLLTASPCLVSTLMPYPITTLTHWQLSPGTRSGLWLPCRSPGNARQQQGRLQEVGRQILALLSPPGTGHWMVAPLPSTLV